MPAIGIDFDDVLADTLTALIKFHNSYYGTQLAREDFWSYFYWDIWGGTRNEAIRKFDEFLQSHYFQEIPLVDYASYGVREVNALGPEKLVIITARSEEVRPQTEQWIAQHLPPVFDSVHFLGLYSKNGSSKKTKGDICKELGLDVFIDDSIEFASTCDAMGIPTLILDAPWNRGKPLPSRSQRIMGWHEVAPAITALFRSEYETR